MLANAIRKQHGGAATHRINNNQLQLFNYEYTIGDIFHDWWKGGRGDLDAYKKCGDWKYLLDILRYGIICDTARAFQRLNEGNQIMSRLINGHAHHANKLAGGLNITRIEPTTDFLKIDEDYAIPIIENSTQAQIEYNLNQNGWSPMRGLTASANYVLGNLEPVNSIESNILRRFTDNINQITIDIPQTLLTSGNRDAMIEKYKLICNHLFGLNHYATNKWFLAVCDAAPGHLYNLFIKIIDSLIPNKHAQSIERIKTVCHTNRILVMYIAQIPQIRADSANNSACHDSLKLFRFPITHQENGQPLLQYPLPVTAYSNGYPREAPPVGQDNGIFISKGNLIANDKYTISYHKGVVDRTTAMIDASQYRYDDPNGYKFVYRIQSLPPAAAGAAPVAAAAGDILQFDIQYGIPDNQYGHTKQGTPLFDLMLHYLHLNLLGYNDETGILPQTSIYSHDICVLTASEQPQPEVFSSFRKMYSTAKEYEETDGKVEEHYTPVHVYDKLGNISITIDSALGLIAPTLNANAPMEAAPMAAAPMAAAPMAARAPLPVGVGSIDSMTYSPAPLNSICRVPGYNRLDPRITLSIKHDGDRAQMDAAYVLNTRGDCSGKTIPSSEDISCIAYAANCGLTAIKNNRSNSITIFNSRIPVAVPAEPVSKKRKLGKGGMIGGYMDTDNCPEKTIDITALALSIGMDARTYLKVYKQMHRIKEDDILHTEEVNNIYKTICREYTEYNREIEDDIMDLERYKDNYLLSGFMTILEKMHYFMITDKASSKTTPSKKRHNYSDKLPYITKEITPMRPLKVLIAFCNIHNKHYGLPQIDYSTYIKSSPVKNAKRGTRILSITRKNKNPIPASTRRNPSVTHKKPQLITASKQRNLSVTHKKLQSITASKRRNPSVTHKNKQVIPYKNPLSTIKENNSILV